MIRMKKSYYGNKINETHFLKENKNFKHNKLNSKQVKQLIL